MTGKNTVEPLNMPTLFDLNALFTATSVDIQPAFNDIALRQNAMSSIVGMSCSSLSLPFAGVPSTNFLSAH
jgi:hypothetical protein